MGDLAAGESATLNLKTNIDAGSAGLCYQHGDSDALDQTDPIASNDSDNASLNVISSSGADLAVTKTVDDTTPIEGQTVVYTITVHNNGPSNAESVYLYDNLPSEITYVSSDVSQGEFVISEGDYWDLGDMHGATATLKSRRRSLSTRQARPFPTPPTWTIPVTPDPNTDNNSATVEMYVSTSDVADLSLSKTVDNAAPTVLDNIVYTLTVSNNGPNDASNVIVSDYLPAGLNFVTSTASQGVYSASSGRWTVGILANGDSATLSITAQVGSGTAEPISRTRPRSPAATRSTRMRPITRPQRPSRRRP